ncbi:MAG: hypothetical protein HQ596_02085 [Candidatus Saganbacteria bacterium]|nr:hypothetical protein [Candidatus Saganbacteria bacterium]
MNLKSRKESKFAQLVLHLSFCLVVFYPFKGVVAFLLSLLAGGYLSAFFISVYAFFTFSFLLLNILVNKIRAPSKLGKILLVFGCFGLVVALFRRDTAMLQYTLLLFFFPILFSKYSQINNRYFFKVVFSFFFFSTCYMLIENMVILPANFGLPFTAPNTAQIGSYLLMLNSKALAHFQDYRYSVGIRTGGYLAHILVMPTILAMTATFFYVLFRERRKILYFLLAAVSVFLLVQTFSTTAIVAFVVSILFYELFVQRKFVVPILLIVAVVGLIANYKVMSWVYRRMLTLLADPRYYNAFFGFSLSDPRQVLSFLIGRWRWSPPSGVPSHVDLMNIILVYGIVPAYLLYKRMLWSIFSLHRFQNTQLRVYSLVVLTAVVCLFHAAMVLNVNVLMLATLLFLKANEICRCEGEKSEIIKGKKEAQICAAPD